MFQILYPAGALHTHVFFSGRFKDHMVSASRIRHELFAQVMILFTVKLTLYSTLPTSVISICKRAPSEFAAASVLFFFLFSSEKSFHEPNDLYDCVPVYTQTWMDT